VNFKYRQDLANFDPCPPLDVIARNEVAYRFVHSDIEDHRNFKPVSKINPQRKLKPEQQCSGFALSFFHTRDQAVKRFGELRRTNPNIEKTLGNQLVACPIFPDNGRASRPNTHGHFDFWEVDGVDWASRVQIVLEAIP